MILHTSVSKSNYEWPLKKKWKKHGPALIQAVFESVTAFGSEEIGAKNLKRC